jgi:hypothetical protein
MATTYSVFDLQLVDLYTGESIFGSGGKAIVTLAGAFTNATLYNPDNDYAALTQPVSLSRGKLRFAIATGVAGQTTQPSVDVYGTAPGGQAWQAYACKAGDPIEVPIITNILDQTMVCPFSFASGTVASEYDTGLDFPTKTIIQPFPYINVNTADSGITLDVGLLTGESGGDADGFMALMSLTAATTVVPKWAPTATIGALLRESNATTPAVLVPRHYPTASAVSLTFTVSSGGDTGNGRIFVPYRLGVPY